MSKLRQWCCRGDCMAAAQDGVVYVAGGYYDSSDTWQADSFQRTLYALDTRVENSTWEVRAEVPVPRGDGAMVARGGGRLLLMGGETQARKERTNVCFLSDPFRSLFQGVSCFVCGLAVCCLWLWN
jgi:hypothetical protein